MTKPKYDLDFRLKLNSKNWPFLSYSVFFVFINNENQLKHSEEKRLVYGLVHIPFFWSTPKQEQQTRGNRLFFCCKTKDENTAVFHFLLSEAKNKKRDTQIQVTEWFLVFLEAKFFLFLFFVVVRQTRDRLVTTPDVGVDSLSLSLELSLLL